MLVSCASGAMVVSLSAQSPDVLDACISNAGSFRLVGATDACRGNERKVQWNVAVML